MLFQCTIPVDSKRFSINIAGPKHDDFQSVLFHFNPRQRERGGQLVVNNKQDGIWGHAVAIPLSQVPLMFGQLSCTIMIQINGEGFDIFIENKHCARLEHRIELPVGHTNLVLQFPSTDDYGSPENWTVYKVWWGNRPILAKGDVSDIPGVNSFSSDHPRKVFISGLVKISSDAEVELRRAELERAFQKYGGDRGVLVVAPTNATFAFVEMESESMTDLALREMSERYRMNRARRSRHEALREERAAAENMKLGATKTDTVWD
jgi:Galactoside-binding lectin/RNA recognition motif. (a.k.a. RRM, RBD, or RNP domain)